MILYLLPMFSLITTMENNSRAYANKTKVSTFTNARLQENAFERYSLKQC